MKIMLCLAVSVLALTTSPVLAKSRPQLGSFGVETVHIDESVKPGDDFFRYANGDWLKTVKIPDDQAQWGSFQQLRELSEIRTRTILDAAVAAKAADGSNQRKIADLYASFMDDAAIEAAGIKPLAAELGAIAALQNRDQLIALLGQTRRIGLPSPIGFGVGLDAKNPNDYIVGIGQGGLGLPDRDYYLVKDNPKFADILAKYEQYIAQLLTLAGDANAASKAKNIIALETKIAAAHWSRVENRDRDKTYNRMSPADLKLLAPAFPWEAYLGAGGLGNQQAVVVRQPSAIQKIAPLFDTVSVQDWKDYLTFHTLSTAAPMLPKSFVDANFDMYGKTLSGTPQLRPRWKRGVGMVNGAMGEAVGEQYVAAYFPPEAKKRMDMLVANLKIAYERRIKGLAWMSADTKVKALDKLGKFTTKIGYPEKWRDYTALEIKAGDLIGNMRRAAEFEYERSRKRLGSPVDKSEWGMTPQTVNAYYNSTFNEIVFPAAILQPPFFDLHADDAVNYGGIGGVIGHEIGHGFDDQGSKSDGDGVLRDWWTGEDKAKFQERTGALADQYSGFEPLPGLKLNGKLGLGENIGDLGGLQASYEAYQISLGSKKAKKINGFTSDQRFFLGWAQVWRTQFREAAMRQQVQVGPHSPGEFRANGTVRNMDVWYKAFNVKPGDKMYLPPEQRVRIW
jgi:putative endopeptidase